MEATLETLLVSGAMSCWFGWRQRPNVARTIELHTDGVLYCFDEPRNSMAKNLQERLFLLGSRVVDCGTHRSSFCFVLGLADEASIEQLHPSGMFHTLKVADGAESSIMRRVALFFTDNKLLKWRFICLLRRASELMRPEEETEDKNGAVPHRVSHCCDSSGMYRLLRRPPRVIDETCDEPLEGHEVAQLEDVLRLYEEQQRREERENVNQSDEEGIPSHDHQHKQQRQDRSDDTAMAGSVEDEEAPDRLKQSPLFVPCIAENAANQFCADCGEKWPTWALLQPFGGFVCIHCVGVHRQLWPQRCRETQLDCWGAADIAFMGSRGNDVLNGELEYDNYTTPAGEVAYKPVGSRSLREVRESYIQLKYSGTFTREHSEKGSHRTSPPCDPHALSRSADEQSGMPDEGPPQYIGVAYITVREVEGISSNGAVLALTNGFQEVRTHGGNAATNNNSSGNSTLWGESLQLGFHSLSAPLYATLYTSRDELLGVAEWMLPEGDEVYSDNNNKEPHLLTVPLLCLSDTTESVWSGYRLFGGGHPRRRQREDGQPLLYLTVSFELFG
ncbi:putative GTP-ase activating protein [Trypanosoma grayi]|uniref:putative GTP-ase activating protein n=1 Tax=Trypanosoma grayi TaxID=71804 RepID=UPI0004F40789|nr:putative GTP-ase activating protein [Trypanosoma grayi]KEG11995.1 putative GTP-ase activating protein [Trypanosoma grayi]